MPTKAPTAKPTPRPTQKPTVKPTTFSEKNGCGTPCKDVVVIDYDEPIYCQRDTCYVVDGMLPFGEITVRGGGILNPGPCHCAKVTIPKGSGFGMIVVHLPRPAFVPRPAKR